MDSGISWTVSVLVAIPLSIVANLATPTVRDYLASRTETRAKKRINELEVEMLTSKNWTLPGLMSFGYRAILTVLGFFLLGGIVGSFSAILAKEALQGLQALFYVISLTIATRAYRKLRPHDAVYIEAVKLRIEHLKQSITKPSI